jgi:hypothetical protein
MMQRLKENEINCRFYKQQHEKYIKTTEEYRKSYQQQIVSLCFCHYVRIYMHCTEIQTKLSVWGTTACTVYVKWNIEHYFATSF